MLSSKGSYQSRDWTQVSSTVGRFFTIWATRESTGVNSKLGCVTWKIDESQSRERGLELGGKGIRVTIKFQDLPVEKLKTACSCQGSLGLTMWNGQGESGCLLTVGPLSGCWQPPRFSTCCHMEGPELTWHHSSERCYGWEPTRTRMAGEMRCRTRLWGLPSRCWELASAEPPGLLQADGHHCHHLGHQHVEVHQAIKWNRLSQGRNIFQENGKKRGGSGTFSKAGNGTDQEAERPQPPSSANLEFSVPNKCFISPSISSLLTFSLVNQQLLLSDFLKPLPHFKRGLKKTFSLLLFIVLWGGFS